MELLDIRRHSQNYKTHQDLERAMVWHFIKKFLEKHKKCNLFSYITDIVITEKNINIFLKTSIAKQEFFLIKEPLQIEIME